MSVSLMPSFVLPIVLNLHANSVCKVYEQIAAREARGDQAMLNIRSF